MFVFVSQPFEGTLSQLPNPAEHDATPHTPLLQLGVAFARVHVAQAAPLVPQLLPDWLANAWQFTPLQQPDGHDEALHVHAPALQVCPVTQPLHAVPPVPHVALAEVWHFPELSQHPDGQDVPSQTHCPLPLQRCPVTQAEHAAPPVPHEPAASLAYGTHVTPLQQPLAHEAAVQVQAPALQV